MTDIGKALVACVLAGTLSDIIPPGEGFSSCGFAEDRRRTLWVGVKASSFPTSDVGVVLLLSTGDGDGITVGLEYLDVTAFFGPAINKKENTNIYIVFVSHFLNDQSIYLYIIF